MAIQKNPDPIDAHVGSRIKLRRMMLDLSQENLGDALGVTFQQIQKYEKGVNRVSASRLARIATALRVPPGYFFDDAPGTLREAEESDKRTTMKMLALLAQPHAMDVLRALDGCDLRGKRLVLDVARKAAQHNQLKPDHSELG